MGNYRAVGHGQLLVVPWIPAYTNDDSDWQNIMVSRIEAAQRTTLGRADLFTTAQERAVVRVGNAHWSGIPDPAATSGTITIKQLQVWCSLAYKLVPAGAIYTLFGVDAGLHYLRFRVQRTDNGGATWTNVIGETGDELMPDSGLLVHANGTSNLGTIGALPAHNSPNAMSFYRAMTIPIDEDIVLTGASQRLRVQARLIWPASMTEGFALEYDCSASGTLT